MMAFTYARTTPLTPADMTRWAEIKKNLPLQDTAGKPGRINHTGNRTWKSILGSKGRAMPCCIRRFMQMCWGSCGGCRHSPWMFWLSEPWRRWAGVEVATLGCSTILAIGIATAVFMSYQGWNDRIGGKVSNWRTGFSRLRLKVTSSPALATHGSTANLPRGPRRLRHRGRTLRRRRRRRRRNRKKRSVRRMPERFWMWPGISGNGGGHSPGG